MSKFAIMDKKGIIVDGSLDEIHAIWNDDNYDYGTKIKGDLVLIEILEYK